MPLGCQVKLSFRAEPRWTDLLHAVGGGPLLVSNGKAVLDPDAEGFRADVSKGRNARSAVGILSDGKVVLVAVEGRPNGRGPGLTLWELTKLMLKLGAVSAMNLDGGSSTTLVVYDRVVTACAGGVPRLVNNALVVVPRSLQPKA
ncbi:MAG: phosphodiester glycosidase family protein [Armatimonadetes bacterium]|nr:phosphodiester glycosidase family protein [Armatimonadota bacterium]